MPNCDEVLKHGIFNERYFSSSNQARDNFERWIYKMDFKTHDQAILSGASVGTIVYGVPVQFGGTFDDKQKEQWRSEHAEYANDNTVVEQQYVALTRTVSPDVMQAWVACQGIIPVFGAALEAAGPDEAVLTVSWNPLQGDEGANPVVSNAPIAGGVRNSDDRAVAFDTGHELARGRNSVPIRRIRREVLVVVVQTTRGDVIATLPPATDTPEVVEFSASPPEIYAGDETTLRWVTKNATQVQIDNGIGYVENAGARTVKPLRPVTYTLTAAGESDAVGTRRISVNVRPVLVSRFAVKFVMGDDGKDDDTTVQVTITKGGKQIAEWHTKDGEIEEWHRDQTKQKGLTPDVVSYDDLQGAKLEITITTKDNGNDTVKFTVSLVGDMSNGKPFDWPGGYHELSQDDRTMKPLTIG